MSFKNRKKNYALYETTKFSDFREMTENVAKRVPDKTAFSLFLGRSDVFAPPEHLLRDGSVLEFGAEKLRVMSTPGHTVGSICLFGDSCVFTGDTVFTEGSYGRTDLWSGDMGALVESIRALVQCKHEGRMYPGHGPSGDFQEEMRYFIR